ncbi:MAG: cation transporter [Actinomycetota bacterium]
MASIAWTLGASAAEVAIGVSHHVLTLVVFGLAGLLDAAGSATLVLHFRHALRHDVMSGPHERRATVVIGSGLFALGGLTCVESVRRLVSGHVGQGGHAAPAGTAIAVFSIVVLAALAVSKRRVGLRVGSAALVADSWLSASGALLATIAVVGAALGGHPDRWWVDPVAALTIAVVAAGYGVYVLARERVSARPHSEQSV